jgi:hypothetical protein
MFDLSFLDPSFIVFAFIGLLLWMFANFAVLYIVFEIPYDVWRSRWEGCVDGCEEYKERGQRYRKGLLLRQLLLPFYIPYRVVSLVFNLKDMEIELMSGTVEGSPEDAS